MATKIIFEDVKDSTILECHASIDNTIFISIETDELNSQIIELDRQTAIKLSKVLKSEISKLT
jgi:hypothetical protein